MSAERWFQTCNEVLARIRATQIEQICRGAELIAEAAQAGGGLHFYDTGHCSREPVYRAGGLCMLNQLQFSLALESKSAPRRAEQIEARIKSNKNTSDEKLAALAIARSGISPGDVLIVNSVSGKAALPIEVALAAKRMGAKVIAITNVTYSRAVASQHSSRKRLYEVAEVVIDNCGVVGDAALNMEGVNTPVAPTSGVTFCYIIWALLAEAVERMVKRGLKPHLYRSVNLPEGEEFNARAEAEYRETGV